MDWALTMPIREGRPGSGTAVQPSPVASTSATSRPKRPSSLLAFQLLEFLLDHLAFAFEKVDHHPELFVRSPLEELDRSLE